MAIVLVNPEEAYLKSVEESTVKAWVESIITRMYEAYGIDGKDKRGQLAEKVGVKASTVKGWPIVERIPFNAIMVCSANTGISYEYLLTGDTPVVNFNSDVRKLLLDKLIEHIFNAGRYRLIDSADGIEVTAEAIFEEIESVLNVRFIDELKKVG